MRRLAPLTLITCVLAMMVGQSAGGVLPQLKAVGSLRFCADPQNLPFSSQEPQQPGFEVELAREMAQELGLRADIVWIRTEAGRTALRQLLEGRCDLFMGLPQDQRFLEDNPRLTLSTPYYAMGHVLVLPAGSGIRELKDLGHTPVAVEFSSLGAIFAFKQRQAPQTYRTQEELFSAVAKGEAAAAIMWAPIAGWMAKMHPESNLRLVHLQGNDLEFPVGIGMRKADTDLKEAVDEVLQRLGQRHAVTDILTRYGVPVPSRQAAADQPVKTAENQPTKVEANVGEALYRKSCAECHGLNAKGSTLAKDLTSFKDTDDAFVRIVLNGRPGTAMAPFKGLLTEEDIRQIRTYIKGLPQ
jgi:ABC-type amino acid transport substrate-binding protein